MDNKGNQNKNGKNPRGQNYAVLIMTMLFTLLCVAMMHNLWQGSRTHKMPYSEFNQMLKDHEVESVVISFDGNGEMNAGNDLLPTLVTWQVRRQLCLAAVRVQSSGCG